MAVIDTVCRFSTAVRGYDRAAVDAVVRAETAHLERLAARIAELERHLASQRGTALRTDDPQRKHAVRAAADMLADAWDDARALVAQEDTAANLQREHAASVAAAHLADVLARTQAQERAAQAEADAMLTAARQEAARILEHAQTKIATAEPIAEQLLADAGEEARQRALAAETALLTEREAVDADLARRQGLADHELQMAERMAAQLAKEAKALADHATHVRESSMTTARAFATDLLNEVAEKIGRLEAESDAAMAELADLMSALSTQVASARKSMTTARPLPAEVAPSAPQPATEPVPAAEPAAARKTAAPRAQRTTSTRKTTPAPAAGLLTAAPSPEPGDATSEPARVAAPVASRDSVTLIAGKPSVIRL